MSVEIRQAGLDDTGAISALFGARIPIWQRINQQGQVEDVPYEALTIYERWLHGGPWMSVETCAILLNHLLLGAGIPLVAVTDKGVVGYLEAYHSIEQEPFGKSLHIAHLITDDVDIERALIEGLNVRAKALRCQHVTITRVGGENAYDERYVLKPLKHAAALQPACAAGADFLPRRRTPRRRCRADQRLGDAGRAAVVFAPAVGNALAPAVGYAAGNRQRQTARRHFAAAGQDALMFCREHLYDPRRAEISLWTPKPLHLSWSRRCATGRIVKATARSSWRSRTRRGCARRGSRGRWLYAGDLRADTAAGVAV